MIVNALSMVQSASEPTPLDRASESEQNGALLLALKEKLFKSGPGGYRCICVDADGTRRLLLNFNLFKGPSGGWKNWIVEITPWNYDTRENHVQVGVWRLMKHGTRFALTRVRSGTAHESVALPTLHRYDISNTEEYLEVLRVIANTIYKEIVRLRTADGHDDVKYVHIDLAR